MEIDIRIHIVLWVLLVVTLSACGGGSSNMAVDKINHPAIDYVLNKPSFQLNKMGSTENVELNNLPNGYFDTFDTLRTEAQKETPDGNFYYNLSTLYGKYEGNQDFSPGKWTLESECEGTDCTSISDNDDDYHVTTFIFNEETLMHVEVISPYFVGTVDRDNNANTTIICGETNKGTCEKQDESSVVLPASDSFPDPDTVDVEPVMTANGINMFQSRGNGVTQSAGDPYDFVSYGAWMEHSGFFAEAYLYSPATGRSQENAAKTLGITTGSNPEPQSGQTLTWNGVMVGMSGNQNLRDLYRERDFEPVQGNAKVTVSNNNGGDLGIGVTFTDIFYLNPTVTDTIDDIRWTNGQITSDSEGRFTSDLYKLKAAFYGPNHEEVAGIYEKVDNDDFLVGSFGAKQ